MPYGTLDIRTTISSTHYYYLQENKTFSFRESAPGVRTNTFRDLTSWDSSPYRQGNLRLKNGSSDKFVMNYRLLMPNNYQSTYADGYPLIVIMHGAVERGNCYYNSCYHSSRSYDPNVNSPAAPKTADHKLLNNDHHLVIGAKQHLDARTLAGTRFPHDPTLPARAFQGFVLMPQMMNDWDSLSVQHMIRIVQLHVKKYRIDPNRIYIHGLSIGGFAVYQAIKRAPWLFAAALPMSAVREAGYIFKHNQQNKVIHIPLWIFQGSADPNPTASFTAGVVNKFKSAGATPRYTLYANVGHNVWNKAYGEADFFSWMKSKTKANLHAWKGITTIVKSKSQYPRLMLAEGFHAYQWERNGAIISTAKSNTLTITTPGTYRARFSRISSAPTSSQWNKWSAAVKVTETTTTTTTTMASTSIDTTKSRTAPFSYNVFPNPASGELNVEVEGVDEGSFQVEVVDQLGERHFSENIESPSQTNSLLIDTSVLPDGIYLVILRQGSMQVQRRVIVRKGG